MLEKLRLNFSSLFGLLLLVLSVWAISNELREYNYHDVLRSLATIPKSRLSLSIWLSGLGYLVMIWYDILGFKYIGRSLAFNKVAFTGFVSSVLGNTIGFALLTGSAIRYRYYSSWGVPALAIAQIIAFANFTFWLGVFAVSGVIFLFNPLQIPTQTHLPFTNTRSIGVIFLLVVVSYLLGSIFIKQPLVIRGQEFRFPSFKISLAQVVVSSFDWMIAAAVLYFLLPANPSVSFLDVLRIYSLAMFAGVVSNVPAGLGVFEIVVLHFLKTKFSPVAILGATLAYRAIYDLLALLVAASLLGFYEIRYGARNIMNK
ncbi:lysylphosphatidylglycerol synthase domain-containing protein [Scytonema sp. PRP1]|uniref:lysylphosphatidylglycerol synthase domain-containing protein n=1 Tax=Scytonema sp. PRP1 TaxID=3120513 RepID=UPI002FD6BB3C